MIKTDLILPLEYSLFDVKELISEKLPVKPEEIKEVKIAKRTLDFSGEKIVYKASVGFSLDENREDGLLKIRNKVFPWDNYSLELPEAKFSLRPVVVGMGPAGIFAALTLAKSGAAPIILERGEDVDARRKSIALFEKTGVLNTESNVQFGEGGAGTYSDGKLKVGGMDKYKYEVLSEFVSAGADEDILYTVGSHLGTDKLHGIIKTIRNKLISLGTEIIFGARFDSFSMKEGRISSVTYEKCGKMQEIETDKLILAIGHSANDTFEMLNSMGLPMEKKGFGVGVRIEHKREYIDGLIYKNRYSKPLGAASYHLVSHLENGRSVYSFCMCPGGTVVAAATEEGGVVTNGMSEYKRDAENSNAAILVSVSPRDFDSDSPLSGIYYRRKIEKAAYSAAGGGYSAPAVTLSDFLSDKKPVGFGNVMPSYPRGVVPTSPREYLPEYITESIKAAITDFDSYLSGFKKGDAALTGVETRTTSPVRILRGESYSVPGFCGLYPIGEGAGYAGGIVSSAVDGVRAAEAIILGNKKT